MHASSLLRILVASVIALWLLAVAASAHPQTRGVAVTDPCPHPGGTP